MLVQNTYFRKLSLIITIALLILGLSVLSTVPAQARRKRPTGPEGGKKFIGPEGGTLGCGHSSSLIVPAGAIGDEATLLEALDNAIALLKDQENYINKEVKSGSLKGDLKNKSKDVEEYVDGAGQNHIVSEGEAALADAEMALAELNNLRTMVANLNDDEISATVRDNIQQQADQIEQELEFAKEQLGKQIEAYSSYEVITLDDATILSELNSASSLLDSQADYIKQLEKKDDGSGEWVKSKYKYSILFKNLIVRFNVAIASALDNWGYDGNALDETLDALDDLGKLDDKIADLVARKKMGAAAGDKVKAYSDDIRAALEQVASLHYTTLLFEFGPHGTQFLISAELVIPWDEILYNDALFWYSAGDGAIIDLIDLGFYIDFENETVIFFIDHFSEYYYPRR